MLTPPLGRRSSDSNGDDKVLFAIRGASDPPGPVGGAAGCASLCFSGFVAVALAGGAFRDVNPHFFAGLLLIGIRHASVTQYLVGVTQCLVEVVERAADIKC